MRGSIVLRLLGEYQAAIHLRMGNAKPRIEPAARLAPINGVEIRLIIRIGVALRDLVASVGLFVLGLRSLLRASLWTLCEVVPLPLPVNFEFY